MTRNTTAKMADESRNQGRVRHLQIWASVDTHKRMQAGGRKLGSLRVTSSADLNQNASSFPVFLLPILMKRLCVFTLSQSKQSRDFRFPGYVAGSCTPHSSITFLTVSKIFVFLWERRSMLTLPFPITCQAQEPHSLAHTCPPPAML